MLKKLLRDERGEDMIEYALLAAFISIIAVAAVKLVGGKIVTIFGNILTALT